jgi:tetratricopeptide (TPR) repeat protein
VVRWWYPARRWWTLATATGTGLAAAALAGYWLPSGAASLIGIPVAGVLTAMATAAVTMRRPRTPSRGADRVPRTHFAVPTGSAVIQPRRVRDADPTALGIHPAEAHDGDRVPPYVPRDADEELRAALRQPGLVLVVGEAMAGKSRLAFEAMRATLPDHVLACPVDAAALARIAPTVARYRQCVVWLDRLEPFLDAGGLTAELLDALLGDGSAHIVVLATMRQAAPDRALRARQSGSNLGPREVWRVAPAIVERARQVAVERRWSSAELARAEAFAGDPRIARALEPADQFGVAESLAGGAELLRTMRTAWSAGANPRGAALVTAAVDCRHAGPSGPVPAELLSEIHESYLAERGGRLLRPESFEAAVAFATAPVSTRAALLAASGTAGFAVHDYLVDALPRQPVPDRTWQALLHRASAQDAYDLGVAALDASRFDRARAAFAGAVEADVDDAHRMLAIAVGESGRPDEAVTMLRGALADTRRRLGRDQPGVLAIEHDLACWRGEAGDAAGAAKALGTLATRVGRLFGADHPRTLAIRHDLACWRGEAGNAAGTVTALVRLRNRSKRLLGPDHPRTLAIRHDLACWRGEAGDTAGAVAALTELLAETQERFGDDHPDVLAARHDLACWRGRAGDAAEAVAALEKLLADVEPRFGTDHVRVLAMHRDRAVWRVEAGQAAGVLGALEELLANLVRILGPDHPGTLATRHDLALTRGRAGDTDQAVRMLEELLPDVRRVLGPDHPHTLTTRHNLAHLRGEAGDVAAAVAALAELYADRSRILGAEHPGTLATGHNLEALRGRAGGVPATDAAALQRLLSDQLRVLGPNHPNTLAARHNVAAALGEGGDPAAAAAALEELLVDVTHAFGTDHARTLAVRHDLACWRGEAGDTAGTPGALEMLLADQLRILGPQHAHTLATRHNLAHLQAKAGDVAGAIAALKNLHADQVRLLGAEHPGTVATLQNLTQLKRRRRVSRFLERVLPGAR